MTAEPKPPPQYPDVWRRFSPRTTLLRDMWYLAAVAVAVWSVRNLEIPWFYFMDAHVQAHDLATRMWPPDLNFLQTLVGPLLETVHIATLGTAATVVIAFPIAFLAARNTSPNALTWIIGRFILVTSRSVNTVVWGLLFVAIFGPGPLAGIWCFRTAGPLVWHFAPGAAGHLRHHGLSLGHQHPGVDRSGVCRRRRHWYSALFLHQHVPVAGGFADAHRRVRGGSDQ